MITEYYSGQKVTFELQYNKKKSKHINYTFPCRDRKTNPFPHTLFIHPKQK